MTVRGALYQEENKNAQTSKAFKCPVPHTGFQPMPRFSLEDASKGILYQLYKDTPARVYCTKTQRNIELRERYSKGERAHDLAIEYGITEQRIYQIIRNH